MRDKRRYFVAMALSVMLVAAGVNAPAEPLRVCKQNPRYFTDDSGKAIYLTGSHVWYNLQDMGPADPPQKFDYPAYLQWMKERNHNFIRLWRWELLRWNTSANNPNFQKDQKEFATAPHPWARTGPGEAIDGKPKFDLTEFNPGYFERLRRRVEAAGEENIYVAVMLFEGWGLQRIKDSWPYHPFHPDNNINGIDGDVNGDGRGVEVHELKDPNVLKIQKAYVEKVIDTVNDLDNVLYEISNENHPESTEWQYHMIRFIHNYESKKPAQHPVGMTFQFSGGRNETLFESPAEWISPNPEGGYRDNPPAAEGSKVILTDTDHLWGIGGNPVWVWKSFTRGLNPIFMDPYDGLVLGDPDRPEFIALRKAMGDTLRFANRMNLIEMKPRNGLSSTGYCLANPGREYLVYQPESGRKEFTVQVAPGDYNLVWFDRKVGKTIERGKVSGAQEPVKFTPPFDSDAVLYLRRR